MGPTQVFNLKGGVGSPGTVDVGGPGKVGRPEPTEPTCPCGDGGTYVPPRTVNRLGGTFSLKHSGYRKD